MRNINEMTWEQRCTADAQARDWAMDYGRGEFYYSEKWRALTAIADGTTTLTDVADALAAGRATPYQEALAASFWVDAADYLAVGALTDAAKARTGHPHEGLTDDFGQVPRLVDDDELAAAEHRKHTADAALAQAQRIHRDAVDREESARRWEQAQDEAAYHEAAARAALEAEVAGPWRTAVEVEYDQACAQYGNDGHPENDRHISAQDKAAQAAAIAEIAQRTRLAPGAVTDAVRDIAHQYAYGRSDGTDGASLEQPDWDQVADHWAEIQTTRQDYQDSTARAQAAAREITGDYQDHGYPPAQITDIETITAQAPQRQLDALAQDEATIPPPGADTRTEDTSGSADPVSWGSVAARVLDDLDQARAQPEAGDVPPEREHGLTGHLEHLDDTAEQATDHGLDELVGSLAAPGPDPYPGDDSPSGDADHARVAAELQQRPGDGDGETDAALAAEGDYPQECSVADPVNEGAVPAEFLTGENPTPEQESYPAAWDAYRSGPAVPDSSDSPGKTQAAEAEPAHRGGQGDRDDATEPSSGMDPHHGEPAGQPAGNGADALERARHAVGNLDSSRAQQAQAGQLASWRPDQDTRTAGFTSDWLGPQEPGW